MEVMVLNQMIYHQSWVYVTIKKTLLKDLIVLSSSLYHISLAESKNPLLFMKDVTNKFSDLDSDTNNTDNDDSDNDDTTKTIPLKSKCPKERKAFDWVELKCRPTTKAQET